MVYSCGFRESYKACNFFCKRANSIGEARLSENETVFKQLITKAQIGDRAAYTELLQGLSSFLKNYLRKRIFDQNEIDEVIQETLVAVHKSLHTYDSEKNFMGWFLSIVEYKIIDYIRTLKKHSIAVDINSISNFLSFSNSDSDLKIDIEKAINSLNSREKNVLTLIKIDGQSISEVAKQLNLTEANVKVIAHRAYFNLKTYLGVRS
jgi:RNA polymerase sigma-70 factor, ECF subfamily